MRFWTPHTPVNPIRSVELASSNSETPAQFAWLSRSGIQPIPYPTLGGNSFVDNPSLRTSINERWMSQSCNPDNIVNLNECPSILPSLALGRPENSVIRITLGDMEGASGMFIYLKDAPGGLSLPVSLYAQPQIPHGTTRAIAITERLFYIEAISLTENRRIDLSGARIDHSIHDEAMVAMRRPVGPGKFKAEPALQADLTSVRSVSRGTLSNLKYPTFYDEPRLTLRWNFKNHPIPQDADMVRAMVKASQDDGGFNVWTGGDELWAHGRAPSRETTWDGPDSLLKERRMVVTRESGGGTAGGARLDVGYSGAVELSETA